MFPSTPYEAQTVWQPIKTAPKSNQKQLHYVLITDGVCLPDIVIWHGKVNAHRDIYGNQICARPAGWFCVNGGRSRLDGKATHWMPIPDQPKTVQEPPAMETSFEGPPLRVDHICIGTLQHASRASAAKAASLFPNVRCAMWAQLDEIGIHFRGILLSKPEFKEAKSEWVRWGALKDGADQAIFDALNKLAEQLRD